jgi:hypothetical protein
MSFVVPELARQYFTDVERTAALFAAHAVVADEGPAHRRSRGDSTVDRSDRPRRLADGDSRACGPAMT